MGFPGQHLPSTPDAWGLNVFSWGWVKTSSDGWLYFKLQNKKTPKNHVAQVRKRISDMRLGFGAKWGNYLWWLVEMGYKPWSCVFQIVCSGDDGELFWYFIAWKEWRTILLVEILYKLMRMAESKAGKMNPGVSKQDTYGCCKVSDYISGSSVWKENQSLLTRTCNGYEWMFGGGLRSWWCELAATPLSTCPRPAMATM